MKFLLVLLMTISVSWAQIQTEKTVSLPIETDSVDVAKSVLLHRAVQETIKQYSAEFNLDYSLFNKNLNDKFEAYFQDFKERKLAVKFGKSYAENLSPEQKTAYLQGLDESRDLEFIKFANFVELLDQYAFKSVDRNVEAKTWSGNVFLNLNRTKLDRYYTRLTSNDKKEFSKIFLISELNPIGFAWSDLGVKDKESFEQPLLSSWHKWFETNLPPNVGDVSACGDSCFESFNNWLQIPQEEGMRVPLDLTDTLWLKVSMNLQKISYLKDVNEWKFEWEGNVVLLDANTKRVIAGFTVPGESRTWRGLDQKALNSAIASSLYRSPLDQLNKTAKKITDTTKINRLARLVIKGHKHLGDVMVLMEQLKKNGQAIKLDLSLDMFSGTEAQLLCFYQGEEKSFTDLLSSVKELKSSHSYSVVNEFTGVHNVLKLVTE